MTQTATPPIFRFAPSPNGALHLGHALSAITNIQMARELGGRFLLRIEDIDQARCTPALERAMLEDLAWLGLEWENPVRRQSDHFADYAKALATLDNKGLIYRSQLTRGDIKRIVEAHEKTGKPWPRDPDGTPLFPGKNFESEASSQENAYSLRLDMKAATALVGELSWTETDRQGNTVKIQADPEKWGDVILARRDTPTSYHMAVVVDDALQGITHVVRGQDLYGATAVHVLLQALLGLPQPLYHHHALILDEDGLKLSKSRRDTGLASLRQAGKTPSDIFRLIGLRV